MAEPTTSDQLAGKAVDFQATAEAYYSIAVEKVKDVRYVAGCVSIPLLAFTDDRRNVADCRAVKNTPVLLLSPSLGFLQLMLDSIRLLSVPLTSCQDYIEILCCLLMRVCTSFRS